ncbi:FAD synthetase 2, chloroplastic isoform X2 [Mangifera indica]|uniref:FAD synthetase 2, chloroplastic isoform X2 n=1 Tax=Mangifera indica TaxID=29780 RepID=UPI001CFB3643|nr:FAD synthetase 2, chloroplastic isoform X2 [Mangifera indica]
MLSYGFRISLRIREANCRQNQGLGFCTSKFFQLTSFMVRPLSVAIIGENYNQRLRRRLVSSSSLQSKPPGGLPLLSECFRPPIVAKCDRKRVLSSWATYCGGVAPVEFQIEFSSVRHLSPRQFVEKLSKDYGVHGVVAGENYRFGYKAAGDASELLRLCQEYGMDAHIINSVMDKNQNSRDIDSRDVKERGQVSSTRVRHALAIGDMKYVSELLGRPHRLISLVNDQKELTSSSDKYMSFPKSCLLNLPPKEGFYEKCSVLLSDEKPVRCRIFINSTHIHVEMDEAGVCSFDNSEDLGLLLGIEFSESEC